MASNPVDLLDQAKSVGQELRALGEHYIAVADSLLVIAVDVETAAQPSGDGARQGGGLTKSRSAKAAKPAADMPGNMPPGTRRRGNGPRPKFNDEEAAEIADYARQYGRNEAAKKFGTSWATVRKCEERCPA